jgi:hypothetical protein
MPPKQHTPGPSLLDSAATSAIVFGSGPTESYSGREVLLEDTC